MRGDLVGKGVAVRGGHPLVQMGGHFSHLLVRTGGTWVRFWPWLLGFMLLAWVGQYGALLVSSQVAKAYPYLVILGLSVGLLVQVSMIVLALRKVGDLVTRRNFLSKVSLI